MNVEDAQFYNDFDKMSQQRIMIKKVVRRTNEKQTIFLKINWIS